MYIMENLKNYILLYKYIIIHNILNFCLYYTDDKEPICNYNIYIAKGFEKNILWNGLNW